MNLLWSVYDWSLNAFGKLCIWESYMKLSYNSESSTSQTEWYNLSVFIVEFISDFLNLLSVNESSSLLISLSLSLKFNSEMFIIVLFISYPRFSSMPPIFYLEF